MKKQIAVMLNKNNELTDILTLHHFNFYEKKEDEILFLKEVAWPYNKTITIPTQKEFINYSNEMLILLGECKVLIGSSITGILFYHLNQYKIIMCEADSFSECLLYQIAKDYFEEQEERIEKGSMEEVAGILNKSIPTRPIPIDHEGNFYLDFKKVQKSYPELSSKKVLLPFLCNELFTSLTIKCSHVMPWLEGVLKDRGFLMNVSKTADGDEITIFHCSCDKN